MKVKARFHFSELSLNRLSQAFKRRVLELPASLSWHLNSKEAKQNRTQLTHYENAHRGERCFIMGNGPSLAGMDLAPLEEEITFGMNRIYLLFEELPFLPTYYVAVNELVLEQFAHEIHPLPIPKFLNWNRRSLFDINNRQNLFLKLRLGLSDSFQRDLTKPISSGGTVTYVAMQIAHYMGFKEVVLIGVDHNFVDKGTPNITEVRDSGEDKNHFHPKYFPKGSRWQLPDLKRSELAYELAREVFDSDGRRILDATAGGKCQVFPKVQFESLFED